MRRFLIIIITLWIANPLLAQQSPISEANELYKQGKFEEAVKAYEFIIDTHLESPEIFYNLGNAYYKTGNIAPAILNYERAKLLSPNDKDIAYNLQLVQKHVVDKLEILPEFFLNRWFRGIQNSLAADAWSWISIILFFITLAFASLYLYSNREGLKKTGFFLGCIALIFSITSFSFASKRNDELINRKHAIVFSPSVTVKGAPDKSGTELFLLHEGTKVKVIDSLGDWRNIQLSDGNEGWLKKENIEMI